MANEDCTIHVVLERKDGTKFFGYLKSVKANYNKSIEAGEIAPTT